jgi:hypothetical protein
MNFVLNERLWCVRISGQPHIEYMTASIRNETFFFLETSSGKVCEDSYKYLCAAVTELHKAYIVLEKPPLVMYIDCMKN